MHCGPVTNRVTLATPGWEETLVLEPGTLRHVAIPTVVQPDLGVRVAALDVSVQDGFVPCGLRSRERRSKASGMLDRDAAVTLMLTWRFQLGYGRARPPGISSPFSSVRWSRPDVEGPRTSIHAGTDSRLSDAADGPVAGWQRVTGRLRAAAGHCRGTAVAHDLFPAEWATVFPLGASTVACTTRDAVPRTDTCTFVVTVTCAAASVGHDFHGLRQQHHGREDGLWGDPNNYPVQLARMLTSRYAMQAQSISVVNKGLGGESAIQGAQRIHQALDDEEPQVLLLEEGVNDLQTGATAIPSMINALRDMVREAKSRGIVVFLATLTPVRVGGTPPRGDAAFPLIRGANDADQDASPPASRSPSWTCTRASAAAPIRTSTWTVFIRPKPGT